MGEKRKLQAEIERCLKKIGEGVDVFDDTWKKVQEATHFNQKEKFEADLKKEIKKLQRLRDQIKTWLSNSEIKDKQLLTDKRKLIEQKMEQFKVVERETKTKAFSKTGLTAEQKMDPKEREKEEITIWLQDSIDRLNQQGDQFESEIESVVACGGKRKKLDKEKQDKVDEVKRNLERHKYHIQRLELIMRLLDNNSVDVDKVKDIKDDIDYYLDNALEPDFEENEFIYDDLDLDVTELNQQLGTVANLGSVDEEGNSETATTASTSPSFSPGPLQQHRESLSSTTRESEEKQRNVSGGDEIVKPIAVRQTSVSRSTPATPLRGTTSQSSQDRTLCTPPPTATPPPPPGVPYNSVAAGKLNVLQTPQSKLPMASPFKPLSADGSNVENLRGMPQTTVSPPCSKAPSPPTSMPTQAQMLMTPTTTAAPVVSGPTPLFPELAAHPHGLPAATKGNPFSLAPAPAPSLLTPIPRATSLLSSMNITSQSQQQSSPFSTSDPVSSLKTIAEQALPNGPLSAMPLPSVSLPPLIAPIGTAPISSISNVMPSMSRALLSDVNIAASPFTINPTLGFSGVSSAFGTPSQMHMVPQEARVPPALGASPLGKVPLTTDLAVQLNMLDAGAHHLPLPGDSERIKHYLPRTSTQNPKYYPTVPPPGSDTLDFFNRLTPETLFFIFYYMEGTKAQVLAAKALKKQSWRFHTKYMMWFQRHEEPRTITDEYEQGTYIYFDFEKWAQRKKEGFTFEYRFLEDRELN